MNINVLQLECC